MTQIRLKRSDTPSKRPIPTGLGNGEPAVNFEGTDPGLYFRDSSGTKLIKIGPCHVGNTAPNENPPVGGFAGNSKGEFWLDTTNPGAGVLKIWKGTSWVSFSSEQSGIPKSIIQAKGDLIVGISAEDPGTLSVGNDGDYLVVDSGEVLGVKWQTPIPSIPDSLIDNKGDIIVGLADDTPSILPVGNDGDILVVDSGESLGVKWETPTANIPESIIQAKGDLIVGQGASDPEVLPVSTNGYVLTIDSTQPLGVKWAPSTAISQTIQVVTLETDVLAPGQTQEFWLDFGNLFSLISLGVTTSPEDGWIRVYTTEAGMIADTRIAPGPPFPLPGSGFAAEVVTSGSQPEVILTPVPTFYSENGVFFKYTNQSVSTQSFSLSLKFLTAVPSSCVLPPYSCNPHVNTSCVTDFNSAWANCPSIASFPPLNFNSGLSFTSTWQNCTALTDFPPNLFDFCSATNFQNAWKNCSLSQTSVDNILISLDTAGQLNGIVSLDGGTSSPPGLAGVAAKLSLRSKGWTVNDNTYVYVYCSPVYTTPPTDFPPYGCNTSVNTTGVTDFTAAWSNCSSITTFPCVDSSLVTTFSDAWSGCQYMTTFPSIDTSLGSYFSYSWNYCSVLTNFPVLNFSNGVDFTYSWGYCYGLTTFPNVDVSSGITFYGTWNACYNLTSFPALDTSSAEDFTYAWYNCYNLTSFPTIDVSLATIFYATWQECSGLTSFPALNMDSGENFVLTWRNCSSLTSFPAIDMPSGTIFSTTWQGCSGLTSFPTIDVSSGITFQGAWMGCSGLTSFPNLNTAVAEDFGSAWENCSGLTSFPNLNSGFVEDFSRAWMGCSGLTSFPPLDFDFGFTFFMAWFDCSSLTSFPANLFDNCVATNFSNAWGNCALDQTSVDNILVSLDTAGQTSGTLGISGGTSSAPGPAGLVARASLAGKGWTVTTN